MASAGRGGLGEGSSEPDAASISAEQAARLRAESVSLAGRQTYIEQAAAADLDQAELELKLESNCRSFFVSVAKWIHMEIRYLVMLSEPA